MSLSFIDSQIRNILDDLKTKENLINDYRSKNISIDIELESVAILEEYKTRLMAKSASIKDFPEQLIIQKLDNTWHDSASAIINNWIGCFYQVTNEDIKLPFMESVDPQNPLGF